MQNELLNDWRPETTALIERLIAAGFSIVGANDGGDFHPFDGSIQKTVGVLTSVDESHLYIRHNENEKRIVLFLVYGNEPGYLVCDYGVPSNETVSKLLDQVTSAHCDEWERKGQPKATRDEIYGVPAKA